MRWLLGILVLCLALPVAARADMEIGMQDDNSIVYNGGLHGGARVPALDQFKAMGGTTVRMNLEHDRNHKTFDDLTTGAVRPGIAYYDQALNDIADHGLKAQITLIWKHQNKAKPLALWAYQVVKHFGDRVDRYSLLNEPDLLLNVGCKAHALGKFTQRFSHNLVQGKHSTRAAVLTSTRGMDLTTACSRYRRGRVYRRMVELAAPAIAKANPAAQFLAGETSAQPGLEWFVRGTDPATLPIDGWAHHPFQLRDLTPGRPTTHWGLGNLDLLKSILHVPIYLTEFGYPHPNSSFDKRVYGHHITPAQVARALPRAWSLARRSGAKEMLQLGWFLKPRYRGGFWETALNDRLEDKPTPAYKALKQLISSWD